MRSYVSTKTKSNTSLIRPNACDYLKKPKGIEWSSHRRAYDGRRYASPRRHTIKFFTNLSWKDGSIFKFQNRRIQACPLLNLLSVATPLFFTCKKCLRPIDVIIISSTRNSMLSVSHLPHVFASRRSTDSWLHIFQKVPQCWKVIE